jgi:hypothetical protein
MLDALWWLDEVGAAAAEQGDGLDAGMVDAVGAELDLSVGEAIGVVAGAVGEVEVVGEGVAAADADLPGAVAGEREVDGVVAGAGVDADVVDDGIRGDL